MKKLSALTGFVFENSKLPSQKVFLLLYWFFCKKVQSDAEKTIGIGDKSVKSFYALFRSSLFFF